MEIAWKWALTRFWKQKSRSRAVESQLKEDTEPFQSGSFGNSQISNQAKPENLIASRANARWKLS